MKLSIPIFLVFTYTIVSGSCLLGQHFEISRSTIDGGGAASSFGGEFELSGTIGQADRSQMNGREYELDGGLWFELALTDCNDDGLVNMIDQEVLAACLLGPNGGIDTAQCACLDVDADGDVTIADFSKLQIAFTGP